MRVAILAIVALMATVSAHARSARSLNCPVALALRFAVQSEAVPSAVYLDRTGRSCSVYPQHNLNYDTLEGFASSQPAVGPHPEFHLFVGYSEQQRETAKGSKARYAFTEAFVVLIRVPF